MRPKLFEVCLDSSLRNEPYFPGQMVHGTIHIELTKRKKIKGIKLKLVGKAKTYWKEGFGKHTITATETEQYLDETVVIHGYDGTDTKVWLEEGSTIFPFYFELPMDLPSSIEMKYGYVRYFLEAIISRPSALKTDHKSRKEFRINGILDLNNKPEASYVAEIGKQKQLGCFCLANGSIEFSLQVPKSGFVPGEAIPISIQIFNSSQRAVSNVQIDLVQQSTFYAKKKEKTESTTIASINGPRVEAGQSEAWEGNLVNLPSVPPTRLGGSRIIDVQYFVKVEIVIPGSLNLKGKVRLIIGTVPLRVSSLNPEWVDAPNEFPINGLSSGRENAFCITRLSFTAPPTYEEAVRFSKTPKSQTRSSADEEESGLNCSPPDYANLEISKIDQPISIPTTGT